MRRIIFAILMTMIFATTACGAGTTIIGPYTPPGTLEKYGGKGDWNGISGTDNLAAVEAALAAGPVKLTDGAVYYISAPIQVNGKIHITGRGTIVSAGAVLIADGDVTDLLLDGVTFTTTRNDTVNRATYALVHFDYVSLAKAMIRDCTFDTASSRQNGLTFAGQSGETLTNSTIKNNIFRGFSAGVEIINHVDATLRCTNFDISNNIFINNKIAADSVAGFAVSLSGVHKGFTVKNNIMSDYTYAGVEAVSAYSAVMDYTISGNEIYRCGRGIITESSDAAARMDNVNIDNNKIIDAPVFQRIYNLSNSSFSGNTITMVDAATSATRAFDYCQFRRSDNVKIDNNLIRLQLPAAEDGKAYCYVKEVTDSSFRGNTIVSSGNACLRFDATSGVLNRNVVAANNLTSTIATLGWGVINFKGAITTNKTILSDNFIAKLGNDAIRADNLATVNATNTKIYQIDSGVLSYLNYYGLVGDPTFAGFTSKSIPFISNLSAELVPNGSFSADTDWQKVGAEWTIAGGVAVATAAPTTSRINTLTDPVFMGRTYQVTYTVVVTSGSVRTAFESSSGLGTIRSTSGTYTENIDSTVGGKFYFLVPSGTFTGTIDNVSVREVLPNALHENNAAFNWDDVATKLSVGNLGISALPEYANNAAAAAAGLPVGSVYRNGDALQIVH